MSCLGAVATGHEETTRAAESVLHDGRNAFDAAVAAHFVACVAEPVLASPGGGGFLLAITADGRETIYDFFAQTPRKKKPVAEIDFAPIDADFGGAVQVFHSGLGSILMLEFLEDPGNTEMRHRAIEHWHRSLELNPTSLQSENETFVKQNLRESLAFCRNTLFLLLFLRHLVGRLRFLKAFLWRLVRFSQARGHLLVKLHFLRIPQKSN